MPPRFTPDLPAALGYRMPAEWEPHEATWLSWPHNRDTWPGRFEPIPGVWLRLAATLAAGEHVHILCGGADVRAEAQAMVGQLANVTLHDIPTNDAWARDHGPIFLTGRNLPPALVHFGYNAWGGKYPPYELDAQVPRRVAELLGCLRFEAPLILEGGAVDVNGSGSVMVTEQCLLNPNRNPGVTRQQMEQVLADYLAAPHVIWLGQGIAGDDTDGHIDELARFVGPRRVLAAVERDPRDENHAALSDNLRRLKLATDEQGRPLEVAELPMPRPLFVGSQRVPASYANFYIANGIVVVPQYDDPADAQALAMLQAAFPDRRVVGQRATDLVWGLGAFHCITQQQPRVGNGS
ncbi:MAG: agmatine deiminase family protein [Pirellulales bacterium]|nr:agmatine deiminase family protein [Pirellulales bacterium]